MVVLKLKCVLCKHRWDLVNYRGGDDHPICPLCMGPGNVVKVEHRK